jgi:hypothetical protein
MPHDDGDKILYGGHPLLGFGQKVKIMPPGVTCEDLDEFKNNAPRLVEEVHSRKGATEIYSNFKSLVLSKKSCFTYNFPEIQRTVESVRPQYQNVGMDVFLCNQRVTRATANGNSVDMGYWFEYIDLAKAPPSYSPSELYDHSRDLLSCVIL